MNILILCSSGSGGFACSTAPVSSIHQRKKIRTVICFINILRIGFILYHLGHRLWLSKRTLYLCKSILFATMLKNFSIHILTCIICRPAGWDNMKKISILHENLQSMKANDYYRDVIAQPVTNRKVCYLTCFL